LIGGIPGGLEAEANKFSFRHRPGAVILIQAHLLKKSSGTEKGLATSAGRVRKTLFSHEFKRS
jgi:hypothetical protein